MRIQQRSWTRGEGWSGADDWSANDGQLVLIFGTGESLNEQTPLRDLRAAYPRAQIIGCSTAGEICGTRLLEQSLVATAIAFDDTRIKTVSTAIATADDSRAAGARLAEQLPAEDLVHVLLISEGLTVNGSELVEGLTAGLPENVAVTGGLSGDGANFTRTWVYSGGTARSGQVVAIGMYGKKLRVGYGSLGGWDSFGPERIITRSKGNVLYELDGQSALALYKRYLGPDAAALPASGLRFPLAIRGPDSPDSIVRTILAVSEQDQSLTFAGEIPQGFHARLMRANFDRLIDGASGAARESRQGLGNAAPELAILISCVGRKLVLQQRVEEELEAVRAVLGPAPAMTGFYSYGEIAPFSQNAKPRLHNQTMTITVFSEAA